MSSTQTSSNQTENPKNNTGSRTPTRSPEPVPFGGDDQWIFDPRSKRFDLTRGSPRKLTIDADFDVRHHRGCVIDPNKTVLVVVDMQNFFIHPDCCNHKPGLEAVAPTLKVIERCRRDGIQVAWLNWVINEHNLRVMPPAVQRGFNKSRIHTHGYGWHVKLGSWLPGDQGRCLWEGSWNAELYEPLKRASRPGEDVFLCKDRPSGMWSLDEPMHRYLRESGKKTILFAGVNTDQCVLGTLFDSYTNGYDCILIGDCTGTLTGFSASEVCDYNITTNYGFVTDSDAFLSAAYDRRASVN